MAIPVLHLNLVPPPTTWRQNHEMLGLAALIGGVLTLALAGGFSIQKYIQASREGKRMVSISAEAQKVAREQARVVESLQLVDTAERLPRYKLAERIFLERALPWSRLSTEMERDLVQDVRLKSLQRVRSSDGSVTLKIRGEAKHRAAEAKFIEALQENGMFTQVVLEREAERAGSGIDFDISLPVSASPPAFEPVPIPPAQVVDQFGKPLLPGAKILKTPGPGTGTLPAKPAAPVKPAAPPAQPQMKPGIPGANPAGPPPGFSRPMQERAPAFNRGQEPPPQPEEDSSISRPSRPRPPRRAGNEGGAP